MKTTKLNTEHAPRTSQEGITLIALVITIIVLLILAGVAINLAIDANGLFSRANEAVTKWNDRVSEEEKIMQNILEQANEINGGGSSNFGEAEEKLQSITISTEIEVNVGESVELEITRNPSGNTEELICIQNDSQIASVSMQDGKVKVTGLKEGETKISVKGKISNVISNECTVKVSSGVSFDATELVIGAPLNKDNYGKTVNYVTTTECTWKLLYQDANFTYLITEDKIPLEIPDDFLDTYVNASNMSDIGRALTDSCIAYSEDNEVIGMLTSCLLLDPSRWTSFSGADSLFSIGSPTFFMLWSMHQCALEHHESQGHFNQELFRYTRSDQGIGIARNEAMYVPSGWAPYASAFGYRWWASNDDGLVTIVADPAVDEDGYNCAGSGYSYDQPYFLVVNSEGGEIYTALFQELNPEEDPPFPYPLATNPVTCIRTSVFNEKYNVLSEP